MSPSPHRSGAVGWCFTCPGGLAWPDRRVEVVSTMSGSDGAINLAKHLAGLPWYHRFAVWLLSDVSWLLTCVALISFPLLLVGLWASRQMMKDIELKEAEERYEQ